MSVELLPTKRAPERVLASNREFYILLWAAFFPLYFKNCSQLAGRKWPADCKMAAVIRFSLLFIKGNIMQDSVKR